MRIRPGFRRDHGEEWPTKHANDTKGRGGMRGNVPRLYLGARTVAADLRAADWIARRPYRARRSRSTSIQLHRYGSVVDVLAVADRDEEHQQDLVLDLAQETVIAHAIAPK